MNHLKNALENGKFPLDADIGSVNPIYNINYKMLTEKTTMFSGKKVGWVIVMLMELFSTIERWDLLVASVLLPLAIKTPIIQSLGDFDSITAASILDNELWGAKLYFLDSVPETNVYCFSSYYKEIVPGEFRDVSLAKLPPNLKKTFNSIEKLKAFI